MNNKSLLYLVSYLSLFPNYVCLAETSETAIALNNKAVTSINNENWTLAIKQLNQALKLDSNYGLARENLATSHFYYGKKLHQRRNLAKALHHFHYALFWVTERQFVVTKNDIRSEVNSVLKALGKHPESFPDRVQLGDVARRGNDLIGAAAEYAEALNLQDDLEVRQKLEGVKHRVSCQRP